MPRPARDFFDALQNRVVLGDGAYGTEFLRRGCRGDRPLDLLNLSGPRQVLALHREYRSAGAELIRTNTFLSNRLRLEAAGLGDRTEDILRSGVELAREAAGSAFVAGTVGPLGDLSAGERKGSAYEEECRLLAHHGCDLLLLETFMDAEDLGAALRAALATGLPVVAEAAGPDPVLKSLARSGGGGRILGVNCLAPSLALERLLLLKSHASGSSRPAAWSAFPSAGLPGEEVTPARFADGIEQLVGTGARLVGGCCGAGPEHLRAAAGRLRGGSAR